MPGENQVWEERQKNKDIEFFFFFFWEGVVRLKDAKNRASFFFRLRLRIFT